MPIILIKMHDKLIIHISNLIGRELPLDHQEAVRAYFKLVSYKKYEFLLREGAVCGELGFVINGAVKQYSIDASGKEHVVGLFIENWWVGDRESFFTRTPATYFIDTIEPTNILAFSQKDFETLNKFQFLSEYRRRLIEINAYKTLNRVHIANTYSAEQKLVDLEHRYPELIRRFPLQVIASYLGMTKETLSRIRKNQNRANDHQRIQ